MKQATQLTYAVRGPVVLKYFGQYCLVLALLTLPPLIAAALETKWWLVIRYGVVAAGAAILGVLFAKRRVSGQVQINEAMVLVVGIFVFTSLVMAFPFMGEGLGFWDAWFESLSGCTTTGLSTTSTLTDKSASFLFARAWMQWYGGLGIVVFSIALIVHPGVTAKRLLLVSTEQESLVGSTRMHARRALLAYGVMTLIAVVALFSISGNLFDAVTYACAAVSTGGYAPHDGSLAAMSGGWGAWMLTTLVCLAGAVPLVLYERAFRDNWREVITSAELRAILAFALVTTLVTFLCLWKLQGTRLPLALQQAPLLGVSAQSTAGFSTLEVSQLNGTTKVVLIGAMFVGGGLGSSAGGIKVWRILAVWQLLRSLIIRTGAPPHAVVDAHLGRHRLTDAETREASLIAGLFIAVIFMSWIPFVAAGYDALDALFEVVSATGTVGLSTGITGTELALPLKIVLCCDMLLGRVEVFAVLVALYPRTWIGNRTELP